MQSVIASTIISPPTGFPPIAVGGVPSELRFTLNSSLFLESCCDIPYHKLTDWIEEQYAKQHIQSLLLTMTGAMLGREVDGKWQATPIKADEMASRCSHAEWEVIMRAYAESMSKVAAAIKALVEKNAPEAPPLVTEQIN